MVFGALGPGLAMLGIAFMLLPWLDRKRTTARVVVSGIALVLLVRYFVWRVTATLPVHGSALDLGLGLVFLAVESASLLSIVLTLIFMTRTRQRSPEVDANLPWLATQPPPLVDVFICTYNEEEAILERTIIGATGMAHPNKRVWVLDDGRREWLRALCVRLDCRYLTRPDNAHAKAGNINHALRHVPVSTSVPPSFRSSTRISCRCRCS